MSLQAASDGLKAQEVERGNGRFNPPIPYIPEKAEELDPDREVPSVKVTLSTGVESRADMWDGSGTKEQFLCHMMTMRETLGGMGLFLRHEEAEAKTEEEILANAVTAADKEKAKASVKKHAKNVKACKEAITAAKEEVSKAMAKILSTTGNFFRGDGKTPCDKIVTEQTERDDPWIDLRGVEHTGVRGKSMQAWKDCFMLMLKTVFPNNAAEMQKFYLTLIRHSPKISVRAFLHRLTTVAGYVVELPGVINSRDAKDTTKAVAPYEDSELANIMKHAFSLKWQTQYDLGRKAPPTVEYLQNAMEKIEVAFRLQNANGSSKNSGKPGKKSSLNDKIPKKKSSHAKHEKPAGKSCALCKKFGGASATHNTNDCKKWDSKGNLKKGFKGGVDTETPPGTGKTYAQLFAETEKLKPRARS
eukprot:scaffold20948_cov37-Cyclotella_meneghiniana.AAC.8